jgi:hypothetical protein
MPVFGSKALSRTGSLPVVRESLSRIPPRGGFTIVAALCGGGEFAANTAALDTRIRQRENCKSGTQLSHDCTEDRHSLLLGPPPRDPSRMFRPSVEIYIQAAGICFGKRCLKR